MKTLIEHVTVVTMDDEKLLYADLAEERRKLEAAMPAFREHAENYSDML